MQYITEIIDYRKITHDVIQIEVRKPDNFLFVPGQATEISINKEGWKNRKKPFTFTSIPDDNYLEFTIKTYPSHNGVTNQLLNLKKGDEIILHEIFGAISYKGEGIFIAGGAGVTPFISIFRYLQTKKEIKNNKLIFANKKKEDIILEDQFRRMLGENFINVLSDEKIEGYENGYITEKIIRQERSKNYENYYLCGPPSMMKAVEKILDKLDIDNQHIIKE